METSRPSRRGFLKAASVGGAALAAPSVLNAEGSKPIRPNVLWIVAEDICPDLGCYGTPLVRTPSIDRFAEEGLRCTDAHSTSAVCTPSRYSVLTGRYN